MKKIKDRIVLGVVSGLIGNLAKEIVSETMIKYKFGKKDGIAVAAGIFVPTRRKTKKLTAKSKIIGMAADNIISAILGVANVYLLSLTGKDHRMTKGMVTGHFAWTTMYGVLSRMGATSAYPLREDDDLNGLINHSIFGLVTSEVAFRLGDPSLFKTELKALRNPEPNNHLAADQTEQQADELQRANLSF
jgi:hypothetical protein